MTSNMIYIVAFGVGLKCPCKIHLNTQWGWGHCTAVLLMEYFFKGKVFSISAKYVLEVQLHPRHYSSAGSDNGNVNVVNLYPCSRLGQRCSAEQKHGSIWVY